MKIKKIFKTLLASCMLVFAFVMSLNLMPTKVVKATEDNGNWSWSGEGFTNQTSSTLPDATVGVDYSITFEIEGYTPDELVPETVNFAYDSAEDITDPDFIDNMNIGNLVLNGKPTFAGEYTVVISVLDYQKTYSLNVKGNVKYDANMQIGNLNGSIPVDNNTYSCGDTVNVITGNLTSPLYTFKGWGLEEDATTPITSFTKGQEDETLYAIWDAIEHSHTEDGVTYDEYLNDYVNSGTLYSGNYYLIYDCILFQDIVIDADQEVSICLNGNYLNFDGHSIIVETGAKLEITDCDGETIHYYNKQRINNVDDVWQLTTSTTEYLTTGGVITGCYSSNDSYSGFCVKSTGSLILDSINLVGNVNTSYQLSFIDAEGYLEINSCDFISNHCPAYYGIIHNSSSTNTVLIEDSSFKYNSANYGGALGGSNFNIKNCEFKYNSALKDSGACSIDNSTISDSTFEYNTADNGGAIKGSNLNIYNSIFKYNEADKFGGAICVNNVILYGCTIQYNSASNGGAVYVENNNLTIIETTISNNSAATNGGGIWFKAEVTCFAEGSNITMADGSTKKIEDVKTGDYIRVFDHETGTLSSSKVYLAFAGDSPASYFTLHFTNNIELSISGCHDLFEKESMKYVTIDESNYSNYIGHYFYNANSNRYEKLLNATFSNDKLNYYSLYTAKAINCIVNDMLTLPDDVDYMLNIFEYDSSLKINQEVLAADINKYGLKSLDEFSIDILEEYYECLNLKYYNIWIGKGLLTTEETTSLYDEGLQLVLKPRLAKLGGIVLPTYSTYTTSGKSELIIGSNTTIKNNLVAGSTNNVCLQKDKLIKIIANSTNIDVGIGSTETNPVIFLSGETSKTNKSFFTPDDSTLGVCTRLDTDNNTYSYLLDTKHTVTYNLLGGLVDETIENQEYYEGEVIELPEVVPTLEGFIFKGWDTSYTPHEGLSEIEMGSENMTLYAVWELDVEDPSATNDYTVSHEVEDEDLNDTYSWRKKNTIDFDDLLEIEDACTINTGTNQNNNSIQSGTITDEDGTYIILSINVAKTSDYLSVSFNSSLSYVYVLNEVGKYTKLTSISNAYSFNTYTLDEDYIYVYICQLDSDDVFTVTDLKVTLYEKINVITNNIGKVSESGDYVCIVTYDVDGRDGTFTKLYATAPITTHTLSFDINNGTGTTPTSQYLFNGQSAILPSGDGFSRTDYNFLGWNTSASATSALTSFEMADEDAVLYAIWEEKYYSKNFAITISTITEYTEVDDIVIETDHDDELVLESIHVLQPTADGKDVEYTNAISKPVEYIVLVVYTTEDGKAFKKGEFGYANGYLSCTGGECGATIVANSFDFTKMVGEEGFSTPGTTDEDDIRLFVLIGMEKIEGGNTISFNANTTDTITGLPEDTKYLKNTKVSIPTSITRVGYNFLGWNTNKDATTALNFTDNKYTVGTSDVTLYAIWQEKQTIVLDLEPQDHKYKSEVNYYDLSEYTSLTGFVVEYSHSGANGTWSSSNIPQDPTICYVRVTRAEDDTYKAYDSGALKDYFMYYYEVSYKSEMAIGGEVPSTIKFYAYGSMYKLPNSTLTRDGYVFDGWAIYDDYYDAVCTYSVGDTYYVYSNTVFYANWKLDVDNISSSNDYEVTYQDEVEGLSNISYQWGTLINKDLNELVEYDDSLDIYDFYIAAGIFDKQNNSFKLDGEDKSCVLYFYNTTSDNRVRFKYDGTAEVMDLALEEVIEKSSDGYYYIAIINDSGSYACGVAIDDTNPEIYDIERLGILNPISGETNAKLNDSTNNISYVCAITYTYTADIYTLTRTDFTNVVTPHAITFDVNGSTTGSNSTIYQLEGRTITLPNNPYTKADLTFSRWNTEEKGLGTNYAVNSTYVMGEEDVTFYAIWVHTHGIQGESDYIEFDKDFSDYLDIIETSERIPSGNFYLTEDVEIYFDVSAGCIVNICLNGHTLTINGNDEFNTAIRVVDGGYLCICDCNENNGMLTCTDASFNFLVTAYQDSTAVFDNINIDAKDNAFFTDYFGGDNLTVTFNNCKIDVSNYLIKCSGTNCVFTINGENGKNSNDYDIKYSSSSELSSLFRLSSDGARSNLYLNNVRIENYNQRVFDFGYINAYVDENSIINNHKLIKVSELEDSDLYFKGEMSIDSSYIPSENELSQDAENKALFFIKNSSFIHVYGTTKINNYINCPAILSEQYLSTSKLSGIIVEEELRNITPYIIYSGISEDEYTLAENEFIYNFYAHNASKDVNDYFKIMYTSMDINPYFLDSNVESDIVSLKKVVFISEPTQEDREAKVNIEDATYEWYLADEITHKHILPSEFKNIPEYILTQGDYFVYYYDTNDEVGFYGEFNTELPTFAKIGVYLYAKEDGYTFDNLTTDRFEFFTMGTTGYKVKLFITMDGKDPIEVTDLNTISTSSSYSSYVNGYWVSSSEPIVDDISYYMSYIKFDTSAGSDFENLGTYSLKLIFEEDFPLYELDGVYASYFQSYIESCYGFNGALVYVAYDSLSINDKIEGETTSILSDPKVGQYICAATYDGLTIYSDVLTIKPIEVSIDEEEKEYIYDGSNRNFVIDANVENGFAVKYAIHSETHLDSDWSDTIPSNVGSYDIKIERLADDYYGLYSKVIANGIVINKASNDIYNFDISDIDCGEFALLNATSNFGDVIYSYRANSNEEWKVLYSNTSLTRPGTYEYKVEVIGTSNYEVVNKSSTFKVNEKVVSKQEEQTESKQEGTLIEGKVDSSIKLVIEEEDYKATNDVKKNIRNVVNKKSEVIASYDIRLEDLNGTKVENIDGNRYRITLEIPEELRGRNNYAIVYIKDDGTVEKINASILDDNTITFETASLVKVLIVADSNSLPVWLWILIIVLSLAIIFFIIFFIYIKKKEKDDEDDDTKQKQVNKIKK